MDIDKALPEAGAPVSLREITADTVRAITRLQVNEVQRSYVASNALSLAQALFHPQAWYRAVYAGEVAVGFVMLADHSLPGSTPPSAPTPSRPRLALLRFMIDHRVQARGFGRAALALVIAHARTRPGVDRLTTSCVPGPLSPKAFYESVGFVATGEIDAGEVVLALVLPPAHAAITGAGGEAPSERAQALAERLIRNIDKVPTRHDLREPLYDSHCARLATGTAAQKLGASIDTVAPGKRSCPYHLHHAQEEMFFVLAGQGTLRVAGELLPLRQGDLVFIPPGPDYPHHILNTSDAPLTYLSVGTRETPELVEYPDSDKFLAVAGNADARDFDLIHRRGNSLDYWEGEP